MREDLRGVFFIIRGQYRQKKGDRFFNEVSEDYNYIGGYDPEDTTNEEWYMLLDNITFTTLACGSDLDRVVRCAKKYITTYKTKDRYLKMLNSLEYGSGVSPIHKRLMTEVYNNYGTHYQHLIDGVVGEAYEEVRDEMVNPLIKKTRKRFIKKTTLDLGETTSTPPKKEVSEEDKGVSLKKCVKSLGVKKLKLV